MIDDVIGGGMVDEVGNDGLDEEPNLACSDVVKAFGGLRAVSGCSLTVTKGEIVGLIGPNGAGKSTLVDILSGRLRADSGSIFFGGRDVTRWTPYRRAAAGMIRTFQLNSEFAGLTVMENIMIASQGHPGESLGRVIFQRRRWRDHERQEFSRGRLLLSEFGLSDMENEYAGNLSGGQKRLLELARSVMAEPRLLLLDEPTVGVSPLLRPRLLEHLRDLADHGVACLLVEHSLEVVEELCDRVIVMAAGRVLVEGSFDEVIADEGVRDAYLS